MTIDERLEALTHTVELLASMQMETEKKLQAHIEASTSGNQKVEQNFNRLEHNLNRLTREVRLFRHFVLSMGANIESRLLKLEEPGDDTPEQAA